MLRRAGVEADDSARLAGLDAVQFIAGNPITIRSNEEQGWLWRLMRGFLLIATAAT